MQILFIVLIFAGMIFTIEINYNFLWNKKKLDFERIKFVFLYFAI